jgi:hypothetical protein
MVSIFRDEDRDRDGGMGKISHNPDLLLVRYDTSNTSNRFIVVRIKKC